MQYGAWQARLVCSFYPALVNQYEQNKYGTLNSYRALSTKDYLWKCSRRCWGSIQPWLPFNFLQWQSDLEKLRYRLVHLGSRVLLEVDIVSGMKNTHPLDGNDVQNRSFRFYGMSQKETVEGHWRWFWWSLKPCLAKRMLNHVVKTRYEMLSAR